MDVDSDESVASATAAIRSQFGSIDVLVNNAGIERTGEVMRRAARTQYQHRPHHERPG
jgi:NAD(P)-dependent dehydrogenase (short-subunit alcohol dehydrogenase family)